MSIVDAVVVTTTVALIAALISGSALIVAGRSERRRPTPPRRAYCPDTSCDHALLVVDVPDGDVLCTCGARLQLVRVPW